jgi:hypothetical protein
MTEVNKNIHGLNYVLLGHISKPTLAEMLNSIKQSSTLRNCSSFVPEGIGILW